jgi:hypothetical protein
VIQQARRRRAGVAIAIAIAVAVLVNVAAAALDARSDRARRTEAAHEVRARLARLHARVADITCSTGVDCTVTLRDGRAADVDPRAQDLSALIR